MKLQVSLTDVQGDLWEQKPCFKSGYRGSKREPIKTERKGKSITNLTVSIVIIGFHDSSLMSKIPSS